jgi:hypothetical protein
MYTGFDTNSYHVATCDINSKRKFSNITVVGVRNLIHRMTLISKSVYEPFPIEGYLV